MSASGPSVNIVHLVINEHGPIFAELIELLAAGLAQLGVSVSQTVNQVRGGAFNLILGGTCFLSADQLRHLRAQAGKYLVFQTEAVDPAQGLVARNPAYLEFLRGAWQVWDYSQSNQSLLSAAGCERVYYVPVGYGRTLERIVPAAVRDIDVLFYGVLTPRRVLVLQELKRRGVQKATLFGGYGARRDQLIARSKIVLNLHQFETAQLEQLRIAYLLNNACFVISESSDCNPYGEGVVFSPYDRLAACCQAFLGEGMEAERQRIARLGHANLRKIPMLDHLRLALHDLP